jgi:hydrogenase maturation protein HypF
VRRRYLINGIVQGVGFRPFVFRLATELDLSGWVRNTPAGVELELQGRAEQLASFRHRLQAELPPLAAISSLETCDLPASDTETGFVILPSSDGRVEAQIAPDSALCADCLRELTDPADRRYHHPFITCTNCGPRWTIVTGIPYDRPLTTMAAFPLCPACEAEYCNPLDRRFHAQPIACPECGPQLKLIAFSPLRASLRWGEELVCGDAALLYAINLLQQGLIVAVKGLGGYHLAVDAGNDEAVARLRERKKRDEKPFAVMVPDLAAARQLACLTELEERLLAGPEAPIVIVRRRYSGDMIPNRTTDSGHVPRISRLVAPGSNWIGLMLAYTPLHQLLFQGQGSGGKGQENSFDSTLAPCPLPLTLVMTSANASDEPMIADDEEAERKLCGIADAILSHNRAIQVRTDDSVVRVFEGKPLFYRRSRGYVPRPVQLAFDAGSILAVGAELKNTVCLTRGNQAFLSQHIGDLQNEATYRTFQQTIAHLAQIMEIKPKLVACDQHPDYLSTRFAEETGLPLVRVQHHHAHLAACMAENGLAGEVIGVIFDGTGQGDDGTVWGGEFLTGGYQEVQRRGHLRQVRLPGGDRAARESWRMVLAWLYDRLGEQVWSLPVLPQRAVDEQKLLIAMLKRGVNSPLTSSIGRLFDAAALLTGAASCNHFDGQAGMALESLAETASRVATLPKVTVQARANGMLQLDVTDLLLGLWDGDGTPAERALGFHSALAAAVGATVGRIKELTGLNRVVLSGGVFQNRLLTELVYTSLTARGFEVFSHRLVPPNDGGIALGQAAVAAHAGQRG